MQVAIAGITGNMGQATLKEVVKIKDIDCFKLLVLPEDKRIKKLLKTYKKYKDKFQIIYGNLKDYDICEKLVDGSDYVVNLAAVIPPHSDQYPQKAIDCNETGVYNLVEAIERCEKQPKYIHISTDALYGNRNYKHPWGQVGDPLLVSPFDIYSATKLRGEFRVLESDIENFVVLRQTAMLHINMLKDNMSDGLMFHTCFNAPLEWATAHDSGVLIANILRRDLSDDLSKIFWKRCFNIGGGEENCITGFDTLNDGFKIIGGSAKDFFKPYYNATRNFHGMWFYDGKELDNLFGYQKQTTDVYWKEISKKYSYYKLGKLVPKGVIGTFAIKRLFKSPNAPAYWAKHNDKAKLIAYFGGEEQYKALGKDWSKFNLLVENKDEEGQLVDYQALRKQANAKLINYYYNIDNYKNITLTDLQNVASAHGGELLSKEFSGDIYQRLQWKNQHGEVFSARPFTVMKAGHWVNPIYKENVWDFDRLSKKDKIFAQIWLDSHSQDEDNLYYFDEQFNAHIKEIKK